MEGLHITQSHLGNRLTSELSKKGIGYSGKECYYSTREGLAETEDLNAKKYDSPNPHHDNSSWIGVYRTGR